MTYAQMMAIRTYQEAEFRRVHGYDWPNCALTECDWKAQVPSPYCHAHTHGLVPPQPEDYFGENVK